ncbi:TetR family transcriptional regulator [Streptomyces sp. MNU76]|uniref:TetR/AcrR family transcriptional regulator n=1 Tax=Streptomyces sp. MNU76 TaxID=2560026 RepID=UPI001E63817E|nr:TetR family transcriptional regulator [Streptomyces sp. MNU76]MCC9710570.1 TetR family transcriptional regulator [Streptomyces sp. MNU76]
MSESGLRERKKRRMYENMSEVAIRLFLEKGFDAVSVAEVAAAAEISKPTIFRYFPTKEDLVLYRIADHEDETARVVTGRAPPDRVAVPGLAVAAGRRVRGRRMAEGAPDGPDVVRLRQALDEAGITAGGPDELRSRVAVLGAGVAKGLEYDHVVVVEPAAIAEAEERGLHRLYVVLTRAVSRLDVVHARALPW